MAEGVTGVGSPKRFPGTRANPSVIPAELIRTTPLVPSSFLPIVMEPKIEGVDLASWGRENRPSMMANLHRCGAILFRGFGIASPSQLRQIVEEWFGAPMEYTERSSPRSAVLAGVYTSTEHPHEWPILFHNENSYAASYPLHIMFYCENPPATGGRTPIADCRRVLTRLRPETVNRFLAHGIRYIRNYSDGLGHSWRDAFQVNSRHVLEQFLGEAGYQWEWLEGDQLRTARTVSAIARHPATNETIWFNHAALFHPSTLPSEIRELLRSQCGPEGLPLNCCYGDGSPIADEVIEEILSAYEAESSAFEWRRADLLLLDNLLTAHAREAYTGDRRVLVALATPWSSG